MQIHQLKQKSASPRKKIHRRIGRGGKRGTYSGRGMKGQKSRAGSRIRPALRDLIQKIPKLRGVPAQRFKKQGAKQAKAVYAIVNLDVLEKNFEEGEVVSPKTLLERSLVRRIKGRMPAVKVLGRGELKKKLVFEGIDASKNAKAKISPNHSDRKSEGTRQANVKSDPKSK